MLRPAEQSSAIVTRTNFNFYKFYLQNTEVIAIVKQIQRIIGMKMDFNKTFLLLYR